MHQQLKYIRKVVSLVKLFGAVADIMSIKTHLKGDFSFNGFLDLAFLFIGDIWHDVQIGYGSILSLISFHIFAVSLDINDLVYLCLNLWCNNSKATLFLGAIYFDFDFCFIFLKNACFRYAICGKVAASFSLFPKFTVKNPFWDKKSMSLIH